MKLYAKINAKQDLCTRTKKDGSGTYQYMHLDLQLYNPDGTLSVHPDYSGMQALPDLVRYDAIRDAAVELSKRDFQLGETVILTFATFVNRFGTTEVKCQSLEKYNPEPQQPADPKM